MFLGQQIRLMNSSTVFKKESYIIIRKQVKIKVLNENVLWKDILQLCGDQRDTYFPQFPIYQ